MEKNNFSDPEMGYGQPVMMEQVMYVPPEPMYAPVM